MGFWKSEAKEGFSILVLFIAEFFLILGAVIASEIFKEFEITNRFWLLIILILGGVSLKIAISKIK